jgi:epoxyqueuosine reductase
VSVAGLERPGSPLARLRAELAAEELHVVRTLGAAAAAGAGVALRELLPGGAGALVLGDGGGGFFARFRADGDTAGADPLDRYTARVVAAAVARALAGSDVAYALAFPFVPTRPPLPMQRLGQAAGLPAPGPLGLQVHPVFGPWWAYRALVVLSCAVPEETPLAAPCVGCPAPCVQACPGGAVARPAFVLAACAARRAADPGCQLTCSARLRCVSGPEHRYPDEQLAFHMAASLPHVLGGRAPRA